MQLCHNGHNLCFTTDRFCLNAKIERIRQTIWLVKFYTTFIQEYETRQMMP